MDEGVTLKNFLDRVKEKGKKKLQAVTIQAKENNEIINNPSAKRDFYLFCSRNMFVITPKIIDYLNEMSNKILISEEEHEEMFNEGENLASN